MKPAALSACLRQLRSSLNVKKPIGSTVSLRREVFTITKGKSKTTVVCSGDGHSSCGDGRLPEVTERQCSSEKGRKIERRESWTRQPVKARNWATNVVSKYSQVDFYFEDGFLLPIRRNVHGSSVIMKLGNYELISVFCCVRKEC